MNPNFKSIQVFEHSFLPLGNDFKPKHLKAFSKLNALHDDRYFDLRYNGIKFRNFVGVIQVEGLTIEILPKIDAREDNAERWQEVLIEILKTTRKLRVKKVGQAHVSEQNIHLLDLYFEWFLEEIDLLIRQGLIKQYYHQSGNEKALKGKLEFAGHIRENLTDKTRFFTRHQIYAQNHLIHQILAKALSVIENLSKGTYLYSRCKAVQLSFPEVEPVRVEASSFSRIKKNRKTAPYTTALEIARLIILNYAPNISSGREEMLALLFDMNALWEEFVWVQLKRASRFHPGIRIGEQRSRPFWPGSTLRPDIVIQKDEETFVIDTKWKNIDVRKPSSQDLRQMYVYNEYWSSTKSILLYPTSGPSHVPSFKLFYDQKHALGIGKLNIIKTGKLRKDLGQQILEWISLDDALQTTQ